MFQLKWNIFHLAQTKVPNDRQIFFYLWAECFKDGVFRWRTRWRIDENSIFIVELILTCVNLWINNEQCPLSGPAPSPFNKTCWQGSIPTCHKCFWPHTEILKMRRRFICNSWMCLSEWKRSEKKEYEMKAWSNKQIYANTNQCVLCNINMAILGIQKKFFLSLSLRHQDYLMYE